MRLFGLIGKTLSHSFSKKHFDNKFAEEKIIDARYQLYELDTVSAFQSLIVKCPNICGLNVTVPYKEQIIPFLDDLDKSALNVGAVNVIKFLAQDENKKIGYNTDYLGFKKSVKDWISDKDVTALVLGTGGAAKAVWAALEELKIHFKKVSRTLGDFSYVNLHQHPEIIKNHKLIINTTPLGMYPNVSACPDIPYNLITNTHYLYDLVYNPTTTNFLKKGKIKGAEIKNGMEMLSLQAEYAWDIWNS